MLLKCVFYREMRNDVKLVIVIKTNYLICISTQSMSKEYTLNKFTLHIKPF